MKKIEGTILAEQIYSQIKKTISESNTKLTIGIIIANNDEPSKRYVNLKSNKCRELGIGVELFSPNLNDDNVTDQVIAKILEWNKSPSINGILVQLPLAEQLSISKKDILNSIDPKKDVDGLTRYNLDHIASSDYYYLPATVNAVIKSLMFVSKESDLTLQEYIKGKSVVVINNSDLIGKPLNHYLSKLTGVENLDENTKDIKFRTDKADIVISATGVGEIFDSSFFMQGAVLIDITSIKKGDRVVGDFIADSELSNKVSYLTPVPGGIGPLTVACLIENLVKSQEYR